LKPQTIQTINQAIVAYGQELHGEAGQQVRADSFVIETNIHYPTESSLIHDGIRKTIALCVRLANGLNQSGWFFSDFSGICPGWGIFEASAPASKGSPKSSLGGATFVETARTIGALSTGISLPKLRPRRA